MASGSASANRKAGGKQGFRATRTRAQGRRAVANSRAYREARSRAKGF